MEAPSGECGKSPRAVSKVARSILPIAASSEGAPSPARQIGAQSTTGIDAWVLIRRGVRAMTVGAQAGVASDLSGDGPDVETRSRHSHCAAAGVQFRRKADW